MQDDFSVFWHNDARSYKLFYALLDRVERSIYDDEFLTQLAEYRESGKNDSYADIFAAQYLLHHDDAENALICAQHAHSTRLGNHVIWHVIAAAHRLLGNTVDAAIFEAYLHRLAQGAPPVCPPLGDEESLARLTRAMNGTLDAPLAKQRAVLENDALIFRPDVFVGEYLPLTMPEGSDRFWVGTYADGGFLSDRGYMIEDARTKDWFQDNICRDFPFDLQKAKEVHGRVRIDVPEGREVLLPVAGSQPVQELIVEAPSQEDQLAYLGKWSYSYMRLSEPTTLTCEEDAPFAVGTPILLGHSPHRKKLVLNILVDALPWNIVREHFAEWMPNIARFFARGTVFDAHFSTSEYTYPALPAIETGRYPHRTQFFHAEISQELPPDILTLAECMKDFGYYTSAPILTTDGIYNGTMRGYDRLISTTWNQPSGIAVGRTIRHIEAFGEADLFTFLHLSDVHPWDAMAFNFATEVETRLPLKHRLFAWEKATASVRLPDFEIYKAQFRAGLSDVDRNIGMLLAYIESRYTDDEYIVSLYSDHGSSVFTPREEGHELDVLGENSTCAAWMMRGAGVPEGATVQELTSIVDLYPTLCTLCGFPAARDIDGNLPAIFGGKERDAVYSFSQFPGQTYKLAVRTKTHAFRIETQNPVEPDGTADFSGAAYGIYPRGHELDASSCLDAEELRAFFVPRARNFVRETANNGESFPPQDLRKQKVVK
jgi:hypothetical protein